MIDAAGVRGHSVTTFTRTGTPRGGHSPGVTSLAGDRDGRLEAIATGTWDAAIDTSGYLPRLVRASAELLAPRVSQYVLVSSISVYAPPADDGPVDEGTAVARIPDEATEVVDGDTYGALKALCEEAVASAFAGRCCIARPGLIVGPGDPTGRFTYWPHRIARGGDVLLFDRPDRPVQLIDVRDLAAWLVRACEEDLRGPYNVTGPAERLTLGELFAATRSVTGAAARPVYVSEDHLRRHQVGEWMELPLWVDSATPGAGVFDSAVTARARAAGLVFRPLEETIAGALRGPLVAGVGLTPEREREILADWQAA